MLPAIASTIGVSPGLERTPQNLDRLLGKLLRVRPDDARKTDRIEVVGNR